MVLLRILVLGGLLLTTPALAADEWRVESVSGDAVSTKGGADPEALDVGSPVPDGATVVSGSQTSVKLRHGGDVVSFGSNAIVEFRSGGAARATVEPKIGDVQFDTVESDKGPFEVVTKWFTADSQAAHFAVKARKDVALLDVDGGIVDLRDSQRGGDLIQVKAGGSFRGAPLVKDAAAKEAEAKAAADKPKGADGGDADADKALDKLGGGKGGKLTKKQSELAKKLAARGGKAVKEGLDDLADEYDGDPLPPEAPKIGLLAFLFGKDAPNTGMVLGVIGALFAILGKLTAGMLRGVSFGMLGNAVILLVGAFLGAALHDWACPPDLVWQYEPAPGIALTLLGAFGALVGACFLRKYIEDRVEQAADAAAAAARASGRTAPRKFG
jgi:hypothetical protein